jgi:hypothetical protein
MASPTSTPGGSSGNPTIIELAPDVVTIGPDYNTAGVAFEIHDTSADTIVRTQFDIGDALDAALRMVGAAIRLRRILTP